MKIPPNRSLVAALCALTLVPSGTPAAEDQQPDQMVQFLKQVRDSSDIRAVGSPPFRMQARVQAAAVERGAKPLEGTFVLSWLSSSQWREEISFPGYSQVRVASEGRLWTARNVPFQSLRAYQLDRLIDMRSLWTLKPGESVREDKKAKKQKSTVMRCIEVKGEERRERELCADAESRLASRVGSHLWPYEYADYAPWGGKQFPRLLQRREDGKLALEVRLEELAPNSDPATSVLSQPAGAIPWNWCENAEPATPLRNPPPHYPDAARKSGREADVFVYAVIAADGSPQRLAVVRSGGDDFDAAALAVIPRWRFRPAMCGNNPIPTETVIDVHYRLSYN